MERAFDPQAEIEAIAAKNGVLTEAVLERAKHDLMVDGLFECIKNLKENLSNSTVK